MRVKLLCGVVVKTMCTFKSAQLQGGGAYRVEEVLVGEGVGVAMEDEIREESSGQRRVGEEVGEKEGGAL